VWTEVTQCKQWLQSIMSLHSLQRQTGSVCRQAGLFLKTRKDIVYIVKVPSKHKGVQSLWPNREIVLPNDFDRTDKKRHYPYCEILSSTSEVQSLWPNRQILLPYELDLTDGCKTVWKIGCYKQLVVELASPSAVPSMEHLTCSNSTWT